MPLKICESQSPAILFMEIKTSSSWEGETDASCWTRSPATNGNGERLNFPALSGSRRVAGSKVNSLPFWTRLMFLLWRCRVSPEIAIKSFSEHKYTARSLRWPRIHIIAAQPQGARGETLKSLHGLTSELLQWEEDPTDVWKCLICQAFSWLAVTQRALGC